MISRQAVLRIARPTDNIQLIAQMYQLGLGFERIKPAARLKMLTVIGWCSRAATGRFDLTLPSLGVGGVAGSSKNKRR